MSEMDIDDIKRRMEASLTSLQSEFIGLRAGRANPAMLEPIMVDAYGSKMPLNQLGNISAPESRLLTVSVWDASMVVAVEKAIRESDLGLNPMAEGGLIRVPIPDLSEERRKDMVKVAGRYAEAASAYSTAREMLRQPGPLEQDLILREARAWIGAGEEGAAIDLLIATTASQPQSWRATDLADFITSCLQKGPTTSQRLAETAMRIGAETLPPEELAQFDLAGFERQLAGLRSGDLTTMKELGYVDPDSEG